MNSVSRSNTIRLATKQMVANVSLSECLYIAKLYFEDLCYTQVWKGNKGKVA